MQLGLDIGAAATFAVIRETLRQAFGPYELATPRAPIAQLVKSMVSSRTYDHVSLAAFLRLVERFPTWPKLTDAAPGQIASAIAEVQWPEQKALHLRATLRIVRSSHPDYDLRFLRRGSVTRALAWLEALPGVGRKISASTLCFSILHMPALVIDTHVLRVFQRLRLVDPHADTAAAYDSVMAALCFWSTAELQDLHVLMKVLGQTVCRARDVRCTCCPIRGLCPSAFEGRPRQAGTARL